jgi:hypothetical protein
MFRADLLLIIRRYYSVYTAFGMSCVYIDWLLAGSIPIYRVVPPDEQQACSNHVEVNYWKTLKVNSASSWFLLYG